MLAKLRPRSAYDVMAALALFLALSTGAAYAADTVFSTDIVDGEVKQQDLANGAVGPGKLQANSVINVKLADGAVTSAKVLDDTLGVVDLGTSSVFSDEIGSSAVNSAEITSDAVGPTEVAENAIDSGEIDDDTMTADDLAPSSVGSSELASGAVTNAEIGSSAVTGSKVATNSLTTADIAGTDINPGIISLGSGEVANGRCEDFSIGVGGAKTGEAVVLSLKAAAPQGVLFYPVRVPSDGTVTLKICNLSGGTMPAISNLPIRVITFG